MYNKYSISCEKKSIMLQTSESKFNYLINYKKSEFDLVKQINKKHFNSIILLIEKTIKLKKIFSFAEMEVQHLPLTI